MARPKKERRKVKTGVTIDPDLFDWIQTQIEAKKVANLTHAVERGLILLKKEIETNQLS